MSRTTPILKKTPIIIDFLGIPGSGKTTLSHLAAEILREEGITVVEPTYCINNEMSILHRYLTKSWYSLKLTVFKPAWALYWLFIILQSRQKTLKDFLLMIINCFYILEIYRQYSLYDYICFLDQGICQAILSLSFHSRTKFFIEKKLIIAFDFLSTLDFRVVHIEASVDTIIQRLKKRRKKQSRLERLKNTAKPVQLIRDEKRKIECLLAMLCKLLNADIVTVDTNSSESIHSAAQQIVDFFTDLQS